MAEPSQATGVADGRTVTTLVLVLLAVVVVGMVAVAGWWRLSGGRWMVVETPSMGRAVPVGSLILTRPQSLSQIEVGDIVTYRPPQLPSLYTHRVTAVHPDGSLRVQGDLNGTPDPYPVTQAELVGEVVGHWRGLGWLLRGLPTMLLGLVVLAGITALWVPLRWRSSARILGSCLLVAITTMLLRPFVHPVVVNTISDSSGTVRATVVSTGLFPTRITGAAGHHVDLVSGQAGTVQVDVSAAGRPIMIDGSPHLTGWWLVGVIIVCLLPLLWTLTIGIATPSVEAEPA